jgi:signal transduction histidine kinase
MGKTVTGRIWSTAKSPPFKLALTALAVLAPAAAIFAMFVGWHVNKLLSDRTIESLRGELQIFRSELERGGLPGLAVAVSARSVVGGPGLYRLTVPDTDLPIGNLKNLPSGASNSGSVFQVWNHADNTFHAAAGLMVPVPGGGTLLVARDIEDQIAFTRSLRHIAFAGVGALSLLALGLGWLSNNRYRARIADITATSRSIMAGDLARRIPRDHSGDDLDGLSSSLNAMLTRIEDLMQALREVSDNIAHDLKTPLTRLRNRAEAAIRDDNGTAHRDGLEKTIEEADGLIQTFNALLLIARLEAGAVDATRTDCDVASLVTDVAELYQPVADDAGLALDVHAAGPVMLAVNKQLVGQAVANLIDNAIKYSSGAPTAAGGPIVVSVARQSDGAVAISIADRGPGIPTADRERVTKRFVRLEQSRSRPGTGLGLSLAAAVARLHGGTILLDDNAPGLKITITCVPLQNERASSSSAKG